MHPKARRRLAKWVDEEGITQYGIKFKPFWLPKGTYGYHSIHPEQEKKEVIKSVRGLKHFIALQLASFAVDVPGAVALLPVAFFFGQMLSMDNWHEFKSGYEAGWGTNPEHKVTWFRRIIGLFRLSGTNNGISGVNGIVAGYLLYHGLLGDPKLWLSLVGGGVTVGASLKQVYFDEFVNHFAHLGGAAYGFLFAFLTKRFWRKKTRGVGFLQRYDVIFTILCVLLQILPSGVKNHE